MTMLDDEFDLDLRLSFGDRDRSLSDLDGVPRARTDDDTVAPQQTCPAETCGLDCQTVTCPEETCGCNTVETCDQHLEDCGGLFTFGRYCEDQSDESCHACPGPTGAGCDPDP